MNKDIKPLNDKGQRHGVWVTYWGTGRLWYKCFYHNGKEIGYAEYYYGNSKITKNYYL